MATTLPVFSRDFGGREIRFHASKMTPAKISEMKEVLAQIRGARSLYSRVPMKEGEEHDKYLERATMQDPELKRREDESVEEHASRVMRPKAEPVEMGFLILNGLAPLFDQAPVDRKDFDTAVWPVTRDFLFNVLNWCELPAGDFSPKSVVGVD